MAEDQDPAVIDWAEVLATLRAVADRDRLPWVPDRRTPDEVQRDAWLEAKAEARADHRSYDYDGNADEAADRYHERGNE